MVMEMGVVVSKLTFKQYLPDSGLAFANIYNDAVETIFGQKTNDLKQKPKDKKITKDKKDTKTRMKLASYLKYVNVVNEENNDEHE